MSKDSSNQQPASEPERKFPWSPWWAVVFVVLVYFVSQILSGIVISFYPVVKHWSAAQANDWIGNSITAQFFYVLIAEALTVGGIFWFVRHYKVSIRALGLTRPRWTDPLWGVLALPMYYIAFLVVLLVAALLFHGLDVNQTQQIGFSGSHGFIELALTFVSLVILPPIAEEIMMRGFLYGSLKKSLPTIYAAIITSVIFAIGHLQIGSGAPLLWVAAIFTFVLSLVLIFLKEKTGRLYAGMVLHALVNFVSFYQIFIRHIT
jgi:membrane protease YdiL (CAAX protease family)